MSDVIDLTERRNAAERPDAEFSRKDDFGRPLFCYLLSYSTEDGNSWGSEVWAYSMEDATTKVEAMRRTLKLDGQLFTAFPA